MRLLLDVNVWVARLDEAHIHHGLANKLFARLATFDHRVALSVVVGAKEKNLVLL